MDPDSPEGPCVDIVADDGCRFRTRRDLVESSCPRAVPLLQGDVLSLGAPARVVQLVVSWIENTEKLNYTCLSGFERRQRQEDFWQAISTEEALSVLALAEALGLESLLDSGADHFAKILENQTVAEIRETLGVQDDLTPAEKQELERIFGPE